MSPKFKDGVDFVLGMPVVFDSGREDATSPETHEVDFEDIMVAPGQVVKDYAVLRLKQGKCGIGLNCLWSSQQARIDGQVRQLEGIKGRIDREIAHLRDGGDPEACELLNGGIPR